MILGDNDFIKYQDALNIIVPFNRASLQDASYDLGLGKQYCKNGVVQDLPAGQYSLTIEPGEFMLLTSLEKLTMPKNLVGHNGLMSKWTKLGLVSLFSPQIDPGFNGILIVPIFNAGQDMVRISLGECIFTIEFVQCSEVSVGWSERHNKVQDKIFAPWGPTFIGPNIGQINDMKLRIASIESNLNKISALEARLDSYDKSKSNRLAVISIMVAVLSLIAAFKAELSALLG